MMLKHVLLGLCSIHVAVAFTGLFSQLESVSQPKALGNLYGGSPVQSPKYGSKRTYPLSGATSALGENGNAVNNVYGTVGQKRQQLLGQNGPLQTPDSLYTEKVLKTIPVVHGRQNYNDPSPAPAPYEPVPAPAPAPAPYEPAPGPAYEPAPVDEPAPVYKAPTPNEDNLEDPIYLTPDVSKTLGGVPPYKVPEDVTYAINDNNPADGQEVQYPNPSYPDTITIPIEDYKYPKGQKLVCTVE